MDKNEIIRMAREAGWGNLVSMPHIEALERFATLVAAHEREKQAEQEPFDMNDHPPHRLCECRKCMEYFTPLPDCDAFAASGKPIAEQTNAQFMEGYRIGLAEMREKCAKVVTEHAPTCSPHWVSYVVAIRAIKFEGDTGFRPVSEMIAEHKQDPKKAAAIEKAKMRKAEQEPVPTGATHYQPHQKTYYKRVSATEWYLWSCTGKGWLPSKGTSDSSEWIMLSPIQAHQPAKPAEQEPVAWTYEEVKSAFEYLKLQVKGPDDKWTVGESCTYFGFFRHGIDAATQRRTSPVRTKDLTDSEIEELHWGEMCNRDLSFARAVIAADRKLNGVEK